MHTGDDLQPLLGDEDGTFQFLLANFQELPEVTL